MEGRRGLYDLTALRLWRRSARPHDGGLQPQAEADAARAEPKEAMQALGTHLAKGSGLGTQSWLKQSYCELEPLKP